MLLPLRCITRRKLRWLAFNHNRTLMLWCHVSSDRVTTIFFLVSGLFSQLDIYIDVAIALTNEMRPSGQRVL